MKNKVTQAKITDLHFDDKNANKHTQKGNRLIEKSIRKLGFAAPDVIDKNNNIIIGNERTSVAGQLGYDDVIIVESDGTKIIAIKRTDIDINSKKGRELAIIDNHSAKESIDLDFDVINDLVSEYDISPVEWELESIDWNNEQEATEDNYEIPDKIETNIKRGDIFNIYKEGKLLHRVMCGDSTNSDDVAKLMNGEKADMVFTSPPYNGNTCTPQGKLYRNNYLDNKEENEYLDFLDEVKNSFYPLLKSKAIICWNIMYNNNSRHAFVKNVNRFIDSGLFLAETVIWRKNAIPLVKGLSRAFEFIFIFQKDTLDFTYKDKYSYNENVWDISNANTQLESHKACFPVELPSKGINLFSKHKNIIFDPFLGSGTTLIAAHQLNRRCYGMEIDEQYCQVILDRIKNFDNSIEIK